MSVEQLSPSIAIRRVIVPPRREMVEASGENRFGSVDIALESIEPILEAGQFQIRAMAAASPHIIDGHHIVNWAVRAQAKSLETWTEEDTFDLKTDVEFLSTLELELRRQMEISADARSYVHFGYVPFSPPLERNGVMHIGLQSQRRIHFHVSQSISNETQHAWLSSDVVQDRSHIARNLNLAGEAALSHFWRYFNNFGQEFMLRQPLQNSMTPFIPRTGFGFADLYSALSSVAIVEQQLLPEWSEYTHRLGGIRNEDRQYHFGEKFALKQSIVPNFVVLLPSTIDKQLVSQDKVHPVWVFPLATVGAPELVTSPAISLDRR